MRELFDKDQVMSADTIKSATFILSALLAALAVTVILKALGSLFSGHFFSALVQLAGGLGVPLAIWLIVRLLSETLMAQHRLNDRLTVLTQTLREQREETPAPTKAKSKAKASKAKTDDTTDKQSDA
mgnify:CR=1 FL=1